MKLFAHLAAPMLALVTACGAAPPPGLPAPRTTPGSISEAASAPTATDAPSIAAVAMPPSSLPPGYGDPVPAPPAEACRTCRYRPVLIESDAGQDRVLLCAREPPTPIKPLDRMGTLRRASLVACDPLCCPSP